MPTPTNEELVPFEGLKSFIAERLGVAPDKVTPQAKLVDLVEGNIGLVRVFLSRGLADLVGRQFEEHRDEVVAVQELALATSGLSAKSVTVENAQACAAVLYELLSR